MKFYKEDLLDHYHHPRNYGRLPHFSHESAIANPSCGDKIQFFMYIEHDVIKQIGYEASGCVLSIAAASKLSEQIKGKDISVLSALTEESMKELIGIPVGINRMQCIMLPVRALKSALLRHS